MTRDELRALRERVGALEDALGAATDVGLDWWSLMADVEVPLLLPELAAAADLAPSSLAQFVVVRAMALKNRVERTVKPAIAMGTTPSAAVRAEVRQGVAGVREVLTRLLQDLARIHETHRVPVSDAPTPAVCSAIEARAVLEFDYDDRHRVVAPYCHGVSTRGVELLRAVQLGGWGGAGFGFGKLWAVSKMENVRTTGERFAPDDANYNPDDSAMRQIHCRVTR